MRRPHPWPRSRNGRMTAKPSISTSRILSTNSGARRPEADSRRNLDAWPRSTTTATWRTPSSPPWPFRSHARSVSRRRPGRGPRTASFGGRGSLGRARLCARPSSPRVQRPSASETFSSAPTCCPARDRRPPPVTPRHALDIPGNASHLPGHVSTTPWLRPEGRRKPRVHVRAEVKPVVGRQPPSFPETEAAGGRALEVDEHRVNGAAASTSIPAITGTDRPR